MAKFKFKDNIDIKEISEKEGFSTFKDYYEKIGKHCTYIYIYRDSKKIKHFGFDNLINKWKNESLIEKC